MRRRPGLDVIRCAAILLVIIHHFRLLPGCPEWLKWVGLRGYIGVDLFFVLSGWLIGGQIVRTYRSSGSVEIGKFWFRRWFRTIPSYFAVLIVLVLLGKVQLDSVPYLILYIQNYTRPFDWIISWSLCIEEHFYFLLPILFIVVSKIFKKEMIYIAILISILISPLLRLLFYKQISSVDFKYFFEHFYVLTHLRFDGLAIGVCLALISEYRKNIWLMFEFHGARLASLGLFVVIVSTWYPPLTGFSSNSIDRMSFFLSVPGYLLVSIGTALMIPRANNWKSDSLFSKLNIFISEHAYTLYLTHETCMQFVISKSKQISDYYYILFALSFLLSLVSAFILRKVVEIPFLSIRDKLLLKYSFELRVFRKSAAIGRPHSIQRGKDDGF